MIREDEYSVRITVPCDCRCGILEIEQFKGETEACISYYASSFYERQSGIFARIWDRIKFACDILRGKEFYLYDLVLDHEQVQELKWAIMELE